MKDPDGGGVLIRRREESGAIANFLQPSANLCLPGQNPGSWGQRGGKEPEFPKMLQGLPAEGRAHTLILLNSCVGLMLYTV